MNEAAEGKEANQAEINAVVMGKMTKVLPFMMVLIMISVPGALALYYAVSNIVAVFQQRHLLKQDEEELEEIADHASTKKRVPAMRTREKNAKEATVTRIVAKDSRRR
jgi:YidC/Oxa1 family membrane protein insertase